MSFSYETKNELCRLPVQKLCCARAEAYGILLYCNTFSSTEVRIVTENPNFSARLPKLFHRAFGLRFDRQPEPDQPGKQVFQMTERRKMDHIVNLLGYDPRKYYTGRSPLEALSIGVEMKDTDVVYRCNLVTLSEEDAPYEAQTILDHSSDEISTEDADILLKAVCAELGEDAYRFYTGTSYRHCMVWDKGKVLELTPPERASFESETEGKGPAPCQ